MSLWQTADGVIKLCFLWVSRTQFIVSIFYATTWQSCVANTQL